MVDITVVIPHRGPALGLWATVHSCDEDLKGLPLTYDYVVVTNGEETDLDTTALLGHMNRSGKLLRHLHSDAALAPPVARGLGASVADGRLLAFLDNHCLVGKRYFERAVADFDSPKHDIGMLHSAYMFYTADGTNYHYRLKLGYNFWAESSHIPQSEFCLYQMAAGGHGGIVVPKEVWDAVGGYGPEGVLVGYAGEELLFDLKLWRYGYKVWIDPKLLHYHYAGMRSYSRHFTPEYFTNLMACANVIGGEKWMYKVYDSFEFGKHFRLQFGDTKMFDLLETAYTRSVSYAREVDACSQYSLDELLVKWPRDCVAM